MLATPLASAKEATRLITAIYNFGKGVFGCFFSDFFTGLPEGGKAFGGAEQALPIPSALSRANANKLMYKATYCLWDMLFNSVLSGPRGGGNFMVGAPARPARVSANWHPRRRRWYRLCAWPGRARPGRDPERAAASA